MALALFVLQRDKSSALDRHLQWVLETPPPTTFVACVELTTFGTPNDPTGSRSCKRRSWPASRTGIVSGRDAGEASPPTDEQRTRPVTDPAAQRTRLIAPCVLARGPPKASGTTAAQRPEQARTDPDAPVRRSTPSRSPATAPRQSPPLPHSRWRAIDSAIPNPLVFEPRHDALGNRAGATPDRLTHQHGVGGHGART